MAIVVQTFVSIQGEGPNIGQPCLGIRFAGCNLSCPWCDTSWANDKNVIKKVQRIVKNNIEYPIYIKTVDDMKIYVEHVYKTFLEKYKINTLMITGGEPFFNISAIIDIINNLRKDIKNVDIETNGTLLTRSNIYLLDSIDFPININISPKLEEACYKEYKHKFENILYLFKNNNEYINEDWKNISFVYKFVFIKKFEKRLTKFITELKIDKEKIMIMPFTPKMDSIDSFNKFRNSCLDTIKYCLEHGYRFSPREHIWIFDKDNINEFNKYLIS